MRLKEMLVGLIMVMGMFIASSREIGAQQWCGGCSVETYCNEDRTYCWNIDGCAGCTVSQCGPGEYLAPDGSCRDVGTGEPPPVGGGGCWEGNVETIWGCDYD